MFKTLAGKLLGWFGAEAQMASQLPPPNEPKKVKTKQQTIPSYLRSARPSDSVLPREDRRLANTDIESFRNELGTREVMRQLAAASPDLSAAISAYIRTAITKEYVAVARNMDGTFNPEATDLLQQLLVRFDNLTDYSDGFSGINSMRTNSEALARELLLYGAMSAELVLDKGRFPRQIQPISVTTIEFWPDDKWLRPTQKVGGAEIDLDIPTFFYVGLDLDLTQPYPSPPLESAIQPVLLNTEFLNDLRRIIKRVVHPRMGVKIDEERFRKNIPAEVAVDPVKLSEYMTTVISDIESKINGLNPEDALVYFDSLGIDLINNGNISLEAEYETLSSLMDAKTARGAKTPPAILGHGRGSQNIASSETLLFMKNVEGMVQTKLNEIYSKMLTLSLRLFGLDVYVEFAYGAIDLRPDNELEAFKSMRQERLLELLSLGMLTDEEASLRLIGRLPSGNMPKLSGTMFHVNKGGALGNPYTNTKENTNNQATDSDAPQEPKGPARSNRRAS